MTPQPDLAAFISARLDEDEATARDVRYVWPTICEETLNPARVLREVAAKRAVLAEHAPEPWGEPHPELLRCAQGHGDEYWTTWPCSEVRALTAVYGGSPDYRQEWA
jgi:hypothetical protein